MRRPIGVTVRSSVPSRLPSRLCDVLGLHDLQVKLGRRVQLHRLIGRTLPWSLESRSLGRGVSVVQIGEDKARRCRGVRQTRKRRVRISRNESPGCRTEIDRRDHSVGSQLIRNVGMTRQEQLRGLQSLELGRGILDLEFTGLELSCRQVSPGQSRMLRVLHDQRREIGRTVLAQQARIGHGARRQGTDDGSLARAGPFRRLLFAYRYSVAASQQPGQEGVKRLVGEAALGNRACHTSRRPFAELEPEHAGDQLGVLEENFVEGANPKEKYHARMLVANRQVLSNQVSIALLAAQCLASISHVLAFHYRQPAETPAQYSASSPACPPPHWRSPADRPRSPQPAAHA